ncbi:MAG: hypothetical protein B6D41_17935 [Chloroflexi bacterium UTCFX4]|nr:MAG: hypothetical protein B6D41_17935 [Chloroflexi bacterium UTCFX4]
MECRTLLERCARRELVGYTSIFILAEVAHRLMIAEAVQKNLVTAKGAVQKLAEKPEIVKKLERYDDNLKQIGQMNISISSLTPTVFALGETVRKDYGLLTNDSLVIAAMRDLKISSLISADQGFARVSEIQLYSPNDL